MTSFFAPKWALQAQAIDAAGDPHLVPGIHLRLLPSPRLGLPVAPFVIYRANLGPLGKQGKVQSRLTWIDSKGSKLTPPFKITPDNPVTGWLPEDVRCCWIQVDAVPERLTPIFEPTRPPVTRPIPITRPRLGFPQMPSRRSRRRDNQFTIPRMPTFGRFTTIRVDAVLDTPQGEAVLASRDRAPYQLSASRLRRVVVTGKGEVRGARWLADTVVLRNLRFWRTLALPIEGGARYVGLPNAADLARERVRRGAPRRLGLHDSPGANNPAAAPVATPAAEMDRLAPLVAELQPCLDALINDTSQSPQTITQSRTLINELHERQSPQGEPAVSQFDINCLGMVMTGSLDPGIGRWLGFVDVDESPPADDPGDVVVYAVRGIWSMDPESLGSIKERLRFSTLNNNQIDRLPDNLADGNLLETLPGRLENPGTLLDLWTLTCATLGHPPKSPLAPQLGEPLDYDKTAISDNPGADSPKTAWIPQKISNPANPPDPQREITLSVSGLMAGATLALARRETRDGQNNIVGLNPQTKSGRAQPLIPGIAKEAEQAGSGVVCDRTAPSAAIGYRVAQADWFGRWSPWRERQAKPGTHPRPPAPVLNLSYQPPSFDEENVPSGSLAGTLQLQVAVPTLNELAPGSHPLQTLTFEYTVGGNTETLPDQRVPNAFIHAGPDSDRTDWVIEIAGPSLPRCGQQPIEIVARWQDTTGQLSEPSDPVKRTLYDPRPPAPLTLDKPLLYTARPDVMGRARVELNWSADEIQRRFRVFCADQTRLLAKLEAENTAEANAILSELGLLEDPAAIADVFRRHSRYWPRTWFDQLTTEPVERSGSPDMGYVHSISGSLQVLSFYRIVSVSEANNESSFGEAPLLVYAVPNTGPPPQPKLQVTLARDPLTQAVTLPVRAQLTIEVPQGLVPAREYRLHRSMVDGADLMAMPIAKTGIFPVPEDSSDGPQILTLEDTGGLISPANATPLQLWSTYHWRVVVRGGPEPGSAASGQVVTAPWSPASVAVSASLIPPEPPSAITNASVVKRGSTAILQWQHPDPLVGGRLGSYRFDIYRQLPGERLTFFQSLSADAAPAEGGRDRTGQFSLQDTSGPPSNTRYRILVIDPLERTSLQSPDDSLLLP